MVSHIKKRSSAQSNRRFFGLELTEQELLLSEVELCKGKEPLVRMCARFPLEPGWIEEGKLADADAFIAFLKQTVRTSGLTARKMHFILPNALYQAQWLTVPSLPPKKFRKLLAFEMEHRLHHVFKDHYYDYMAWPSAQTDPKLASPSFTLSASRASIQQFQREAAATAAPGFGQAQAPAVRDERADVRFNGSANKFVDVLLVSASKSNNEAYAHAFKQAGFKPISFEIKAVSMLRFLKYVGMLTDSNENVLVADVKLPTIDFSIFHGTGLKLTRQSELNIHEIKNMTQEQFLDEIEQETSRLLHFYHYNMNQREQTVSKFIISGDAGALKLAPKIEERLWMPVKTVPMNRLRFGADHVGDAHFPYAAVIGSALRGDKR